MTLSSISTTIENSQPLDPLRERAAQYRGRRIVLRREGEVGGCPTSESLTLLEKHLELMLEECEPITGFLFSVKKEGAEGFLFGEAHKRYFKPRVIREDSELLASLESALHPVVVEKVKNASKLIFEYDTITERVIPPLPPSHIIPSGIRRDDYRQSIAKVYRERNAQRSTISIAHLLYIFWKNTFPIPDPVLGEIEELETIETQHQVMLTELRNPLDNESEYEIEVLDAIQMGDLESLALIEAGVYERRSEPKNCMIARNRQMAHRLRELFTDRAFVSVGALHLVGPHRMQEELQHLGFTVTRIPLP